MTTNDIIKKFTTTDDIDTTIVNINHELKNISSRKCRLNKMTTLEVKKNELQELLVYENEVKLAKSKLQKPSIIITTITDEDIKKLDLISTIKAIKTIQSKKCNSQYLKDKKDYTTAVEIEEKLKEHKLSLQLNTNIVSKVKVSTIIENSKDLTKDEIIQLLLKL